jgi:tRNA(adenine34) deaminase
VPVGHASAAAESQGTPPTFPGAPGLPHNKGEEIRSASALRICAFLGRSAADYAIPSGPLSDEEAMAKKKPDRKKSVKKKPEKKKPEKSYWVHKVKTVSTFPPEGTFNKNAETIAKVMVSHKVSPKGIGSGIRMIQYFINRAGKGLSGERKEELEKAKRILQARLHEKK